MSLDSTIRGETLARLVEHCWEPLDVKVVLAVALHGGEATPVAVTQLLNDELLRRAARGDGSLRGVDDRLTEAVDRLAAKRLLLDLRDDGGGRWLLLGVEENVDRARTGEILVPGSPPIVLERSTPSVYELYEQNVGLLSPILADRIAEALDLYPVAWVEEAIGEAVAYNRRSWRYIERILQNWATKGRGNETNRRDHEEHLDPEKYTRGKYSSLFRRD
jgi:DnaD/phage-associated family protein